jgi:hypothetical protein
MAKTREELLESARYHIEMAESNAKSYNETAHVHAHIAQACVALAKELREAEQSPTYPQVDEIIDALRKADGGF